MGRIILIYLLIIFLLDVIPGRTSAQERTDTFVVSHRDSVQINFRQSKWNLDLNIGHNVASLDSIDRRLTTVLNNSVYRLRRVSVFGGASPEGSVAFNKFLSEHRAETLFGWFDKYGQLSDLDKRFTFFGRNWEGVLRLAEKDPGLPFRDETLSLLRTIVGEKRASGGEEPKQSLERMKQLCGGIPYSYLYKHIFPTVRASKVVIDYDRVLAPGIAEKPKPADTIVIHDTVYIDRIVERHDTVYIRYCPKKPFYMAVYTNMLYDAVAVPNLGIEFYLGRNWSIAANYMHAWWSYDPRHRYWRIYGGEINVRRWFGQAALEKPLTGHHIGAYVQALTYDFEWGGKGYMGGQPRGTIFDLAHFGGGVEYGYSLPVGRRFNIDFSVGVGYIGGKVHEFIPENGHYRWTATKQKHWFGPTKLEVSLVWLIGRGNVNEKKGGAR